MDLPRSAGAHPGHRARRRRPPPVPLPPRLAGRARPRQARSHAGAGAGAAPPAPEGRDATWPRTAWVASRVLASAVRLLELGLFRVGGEGYTEDNGSYGLATLRKGHVRVHGDELRFDYPGKSGQRRVVAIGDRRVAEVVRALKRRRRGGPELLAYKDERGRWRDVTSADVNAYLQDALGDGFSAKDFRTWTATVLAAVGLALEDEPDMSERQRRASVVAVVRDVAHQLGNTPTVARGSYVDPRVIERFEEGHTVGDAVADRARRGGGRRAAGRCRGRRGRGGRGRGSGGRRRRHRAPAPGPAARDRAGGRRPHRGGAPPAPPGPAGTRAPASRPVGCRRGPIHAAPRDLAAYDAKRDFGRTPEPAGAPPRSADGAGGIFVVQRHRARRLHYDLRLEVDGVLASWAVPKGPTLDPAVRSLAVQVEDHPMEYADFEGVIPSGEYGGGDVIVWDRGTWAPARTDDPAAAIAAGELHFDLTGDKLAGRFVLVRTGSRRARPQPVAAAAQARRRRPDRLEPRGPPGIGEVGPHQRRGPRGARGPVAQRPARLRGRGRRRPGGVGGGIAVVVHRTPGTEERRPPVRRADGSRAAPARRARRRGPLAGAGAPGRSGGPRRRGGPPAGRGAPHRPRPRPAPRAWRPRRCFRP